MKKETMHLGQTVRYGEKMGVVDTLTQTGLALVMEDGTYVLCSYCDVAE